ncbi:DUF6021 family protein [Pseudomonas sp. NPDC090208]|uniref:DUF6021 family protein n=1 Tax=Pseudomonas sp. NPDC090208 TaxID=3364478 RepID=UPI00381E4CC6
MAISHEIPGHPAQEDINIPLYHGIGFDPRARSRDAPAWPEPSSEAGEEGGVEDDIGFDPESPDLSDPQVDPLHPARTSNDPVRRKPAPEDDDEQAESGA